MKKKNKYSLNIADISCNRLDLAFTLSKISKLNIGTNKKP